MAINVDRFFYRVHDDLHIWREYRITYMDWFKPWARHTKMPFKFDRNRRWERRQARYGRSCDLVRNALDYWLRPVLYYYPDTHFEFSGKISESDIAIFGDVEYLLEEFRKSQWPKSDPYRGPLLTDGRENLFYGSYVTIVLRRLRSYDWSIKVYEGLWGASGVYRRTGSRVITYTPRASILPVI